MIKMIMIMRRRIELFLVANYYFTNQKSTNFIIIVVIIMIVAVAVVVVIIIIMMNNAVADQKWNDFFNTIYNGEIAEVKMLFEANRSLFQNSAFPDYAAYV